MLKQVVNELFTVWVNQFLAWRRRDACNRDHRAGKTPPLKNRAGLALLVIFSLLISVLLAPASAQTGLSDIEGHWAQPCIEELTQQQIISGYPDGTFRPNAPVTRAEFATMIRKAFPNAPRVRNATQFVDIPSNYWAVDEIRMANQTGFLSGYLGRIFNPLLKIPREQVLVALVSGLKYSPTQPVNETLNLMFDDAGEIRNYARNAIAAATEKQLVVNYPDVRQVKPQQLASRGEVAAIFCQALGLSGLVSPQYIPGTEVPTPSIETPTSSITTPNFAVKMVSSTAQNAAPSSEIRGVWLTNIDSDVLFSRANLTRALQRLKQLNFNTVYPVVWNWGYTLYPSKVAEKAIGRSLDPTPGLQGRDMLKEAIEQGHKLGLTVMPWFEFGFMAPAESELAKRHPEWLTQRRDGNKIWNEGSHPRVWLNPFHPEVQQFIIDLATEIVANYDLDGIQFDDHFGLPAEFGYDNYTVELYKKELPGLSPSDQYYETFWVRWRADKLNDFMTRLAQAIKAIKPDCIISLSPNPLHFSLPAHLQDWFTWEQRGLIQEIVLQVYRNDLNRFITELGRAEVELAQSRLPVSVGILTGLKNRGIPMEQIQTQVETVRQMGFAGVSFFFYESLWNWAQETPAQRESAWKNLFSKPAQRPDQVQSRTTV